MATHPKPTDQNRACYEWLMALVGGGCRVIVPEIAYYEVRRELLRARKESGLRRLDTVVSSLEYLPINTTAMLKAAEFWAVDGDVILTAQAVMLGEDELVVATTNVAHFALFVSAELWENIVLE
jgi:hypothetical protein